MNQRENTKYEHASSTEEIALRDRIITHAGPRFFEEGFSRITTDEISRELGISKKTLYRHFRSKNEILAAVVRGHLATVKVRLDEIYGDESKSFVEVLRHQIEVASEIFDRLTKPFMRDLGRYAPEVWEEIQAFRQKNVFARLERAIQLGKDEGMIRREVDPRLTVAMVVAIAESIIVPRRIAEMDTSVREVISHVVMLLSNGILTEEGQACLPRVQALEKKGDDR